MLEFVEISVSEFHQVNKQLEWHLYFPEPYYGETLLTFLVFNTKTDHVVAAGTVYKTTDTKDDPYASVYIAYKYRGKGILEKLYKWLVQQLDEGFVYAEVSMMNLPSTKAHRKLRISPCAFRSSLASVFVIDPTIPAMDWK